MAEYDIARRAVDSVARLAARASQVRRLHLRRRPVDRHHVVRASASPPSTAASARSGSCSVWRSAALAVGRSFIARRRLAKVARHADQIVAEVRSLLDSGHPATRTMVDTDRGRRAAGSRSRRSWSRVSSTRYATPSTIGPTSTAADDGDDGVDHVSRPAPRRDRDHGRLRDARADLPARPRPLTRIRRRQTRGARRRGGQRSSAAPPGSRPAARRPCCGTRGPRRRAPSRRRCRRRPGGWRRSPPGRTNIVRIAIAVSRLPRPVDVADDAGVRAALDRFELVDDLHRPHLRRPAHRAGRQRRPQHVDRAEPVDAARPTPAT